MSHDNHSILVFDSGIGGLSVVKALRESGAPLGIDFLADSLYFPYGSRTNTHLKQRIITLIGEAIRRISPALIVIACNTASTLALEELRTTFPDQIFIGCVPPLRLIARKSHTKTIGLLATPATTHRHYLSTLQERYAPDCTVITQAAPHLAQYAENFFQGKHISKRTIKKEIEGLFHHPQSDRLDNIGIGCTHYSFFLPIFKELTPKHIQWIDPAPAVARQTRHVFEEMSLKDNVSKQTKQYFWVTGEKPKAHAYIEHILDFGFTAIKHF